VKLKNCHLRIAATLAFYVQQCEAELWLFAGAESAAESSAEGGTEWDVEVASPHYIQQCDILGTVEFVCGSHILLELFDAFLVQVYPLFPTRYSVEKLLVPSGFSCEWL